MFTPRINYEKLIAYAAGALTEQEAATVQALIERDSAAARTVALYRTVQETAAGDDSVEPSPEAMARAKAIFSLATPPAESPAASWLNAVDQFIARLIFDSRVHPAAVRSTSGVADRVNLTYETDGVEIDIQAERIETLEGEEHWRVIGQVSETDDRLDGQSPEPHALAWGRKGAADALVELTTDDQGGFALEVAPGNYELYLKLPNRVVVIRDIDLG